MAEQVVEWPVAVGVPPREADAFQSRPALRDAIRTSLAASATTRATQVVVAGGGGVGKTQLAAAVYRDALAGYGTGAGVDAAVWVTAASRAAVISTYAMAYTRTHPGAAGDADEHAAAFLEWLAATARRWLVVLDDVADPADLAGLWPAGPGGMALVTTRRRDAAVSRTGMVIEMDVFTVEEATGYLSAKLAEAPGVPAGVLNEAHRLATDLGYLPLALSHAAAVVVNDGITCADYRVLLADRRQRLDEVFPSHAGEAGDEYAHTVAGTWSLARERANLLNPAGLAGPMLDLISMLDPNGIPEVVLTSGPVDIYLQTGQGATGQDPPAGSTLSTPSAATRRVLRNLWRLSLISHDPNDECRSVRIHALAQRAAIEQLSPTAAAAAIHTAADALTSVWPTAEAGTLLGQVLRANASVLAARDPTLLRKPNTHPILFRLGNSLGEAGLVGNAIAHFTTLTSDSGRLLGADHPDTLTARAELARWRGMAGDAAGAVAALEELLTDMLPVLDPDDSRPRAVRAELARWRGVAGDAAGAVAALEELLADLLRTLGPDHAETLAVRGNLAYVLAEAKQWARAVAALEDLLTDRARLDGPNHPDTLATRHMLACYTGEAGDPASAVAALGELLADRIRVLGPDHPETLATRHELARWRGELGDPAGAVAALEELLPDMLRVLGPDHPWTMGTRHELARWRGELGDPAGAVAALEELLADRMRVLGPDHPWTMGTQHELARWRGELGDPAGAVAALEELLADRVRVLGPDHPDTLRTRESLAYWRNAGGQG